MSRKLQPTSIAGIEFDALVDESRELTATVPEYPVEDGYSVSDTIINDPQKITLTLYITNTPVTWLYRHGTSVSRVQQIENRLVSMWEEKQLQKIVTTNAIYTDMGITSIKITHAQEDGYAKKVTIEAKKVITTTRETVLIPSYVLKSGESEASAGTASTSATSSKSGASGGGYATESSGGISDGSSSSSSKSSSEKGHSILYGVASGLGIIKK